jgi:hypothetical protein
MHLRIAEFQEIQIWLLFQAFIRNPRPVIYEAEIARSKNLLGLLPELFSNKMACILHVGP